MKAPEFPKDLRWLNSRPLVMKELRGKAVLIDFWTYSCVNCLRTLPHVKAWHSLYKDKGLVIIGVHTPEFDFEKDPRNVERAVKEAGILYPVVEDSDYQIWSLYGNQYWPRKYLVDKEGKIVYDHAGEGSYNETEQAIQHVLLEIDPLTELPKPTEETGTGGICYPTTQETYLGSLRGRPGKVWKTEGVWKAFPEYVEHEEKTPEYQDRLVLNFEASEVNVVAESLGERPAKAELRLNGEPFQTIEISGAKMYSLIQGKKFMQGELSIYVKDERVRFYAFTFGGNCD